jgi:hypothetical protein
MVAMLGRAYHPYESRVIAHDNVVQQIRKGGTENNGLHFAPEEEAMSVLLGIVCTGDVGEGEGNSPEGGRSCSQRAHALSIQYNLQLQSTSDGAEDFAKEKGVTICSCCS